jgi:hypothetical protein
MFSGAPYSIIDDQLQPSGYGNISTRAGPDSEARAAFLHEMSIALAALQHFLQKHCYVLYGLVSTFQYSCVYEALT